MNWIGKEHKKEIPAERKVKRAKIILAVMAVAIATIIFVPGRKKAAPTGQTPVEAKMNGTLDSLIRSLGYDTYEVYHTGDVETLKESLDCPEKDMLAAVIMRINMITSMTSISAKEKMKRLDDALEEKKALQDKIDEFYATGTETEYYSRRIRFSTQEGGKYTFFQQIYPTTGIVKTKYFKDITGTSNAGTELEELKKMQKKDIYNQ